MNDNIKKLYDELKGGGADVGSPDEFNNWLSAKGEQGYKNRLSVYNELKNGGADVGSYDDFRDWMGFRAVKPSKPTSQTVAPKPAPAKPAQQSKPKGTPMTEAERQNMLNGISGMVAQSKAGLQRTKNRMNYAKANTGLRVPGVTLGVKGGGVHLGQNGKVVETKPQYNAESGKVERSYLTESGNEYKERGGADLEQNAIDEARFQSEQQEAYLLREKQRIEQEMNQRGRELDAEAVDFSWRDMPRGSGGAIHTYNSSTVNGRFADTKYKSLLAQLNKVNDGLATLAEAKKGKASDQWIDDSSNWASKKGKQLLAFGAGAWRGLAHAVGKVSTWDMGMTDMATNGALYTAAVDADRKGIDNISREDRDLLDITAYTNAIQSENEQYLGRGYKAGQVTGESLPFMIEMMLNPASKLGTTATNKLMREAVKRYGKEAVKKATKKYLAAKIGTRLMGDAVGSMAMAGTTGQGHVTADMLNRLTGDVQFKVDDSGKIVYGGREGAEDSVLKAYMKAFGAQTIENHSEMVGEYFAPFLGKAASLTRKGMDKIGLGKVNKLIDDIGATNAAKMLGDFEKQTKWNGTFGEYAEEVVGNIENALLVGDNTLDTAKGTGVFNADQNIDTFLGVSLMGGFFAGAKTLSYRGPKRQALNEMSDAGKVIDNAIGDNVPIMEKWGGWRNTFLVGTDEEKKAALREVMDNTDLPIKFRMGVLNFVKAAQKYEGIVRAQESKVKDGEQDPVAQSSDESYDNGYDTTEPEAMNDAKNMYDYKRQQMSAIVTDEFLADFDNDPVGTLSQVMGRDDFSEDEKLLALDYVNAKATYDGMIDRVRDDIDSRIEESNATVNSRTNRNDGMIHPATLWQAGAAGAAGSDRQVYVVSGNVVLFEDGSGIDVRRSDKTLIVRDAETGELRWAAPEMLSGLDESIDPATEKEAAQQALREQYAQEQSDNIDGVLAFNVGDTYDLADGSGQQCSAQIVADNGDGTVQVAWNGDPNNISTARKDELQSMRDIHNRARINDYEQQRAAQRQEQQAEAAEPQRRTYNLNDEITLRDEEGNPVRGSITAEENEDGEIEVYTEHPINGKQVQLLRRDELDNMLLEQNGEVVENVPSEETPSVINLTDDESEDNAETPVTAEEGAEGATLEPANATSEEQHIEEEQHAEPMPMIGEGEDAEPDFASVTPQRAHEYIFNESGLDEEDARDFMTNNLRAAETAVTKIKNNKPKMGTSIAKFNKDKAEWQRKLDEANANLDYWQQVKAERNAVLAERAKAQQEADKKQAEEAQAAEAAYREEMAKKEAEQAALGTNTVSPAIRDKWNAAPKVEGAQNEIVLANGEKVAGRYYLVESGAATPSHNSANGFAKSEGFPVDENGGSVNDRDYERDKDAQQITRDIANKYDSRAMQTPVVVSQDGVVLSGNGRTMAGELAAAQGTDAEYNEHLAKYPTQYGFTSEQVKGMQHPRVVFVPDAAMPYTADTFAKFNQQEMKGQSKTEHSVKLGKVVDDETFNRIISLINRFDTLGDFYADFTASREAIGELFKCGAISRPQMAEMVDGDGLSAIGKETLENMLIGKAFESNPDAVREATEFKQMRQTIIQALAEISNNISLGKDYSLELELAEAIDLVYNARKSGFKAGDRVSSYARQQQFDFYGVPSTVADYKNATMLMIADILNDNRSTLLKKYLQLYNTNAKDAANGQLDIFSGTVASKESILNDVNELLNYGTEEEQKKAAQEAVEKRKAESVAEAGVIDNGSEGSNEDNDRVEETPAEQAPTEEEGSKPVMSHDEKMAFMRQFLEDTTGDMRLLDVVTDEEVQKLIDLYDAWEVVNDGLGAAHDANDALLNDKNKVIAQKAKENIETAENAANAAFAPVEDYYNELLNTHNIEDEEGDADETETPSAETPLSDAISAAEAETDQNPTDGQKEAGNYKKGHVQVGTFDITIENPKGSVRRGKDANGKEWESKMNNTYGYFRGTEGVDGDHIDVFISNDIDGWDGRKVFVVDQYNPDGSFDEHKVMLGFNDADEAKSDYLANYEKGWENGRRIDVSVVNLEDFEKWIASSKRKTKPFSEYKNVKSESSESPKTEKKNSASDNTTDTVGTAESGKRNDTATPQNTVSGGKDTNILDAKQEKTSLTDEEVMAITDAMKANAVIAPTVEINDANWKESVDTPIGAVKMGENQKAKLFAKGREQQYGMLLETLSNPDVVLEEKDKEQNMFHERPSSYLFVKTFQKEDGSKYVHFESVTVSQDGMEVSISSHIIRENQLKNKLKSDRLLYKATALDAPANTSAEQPIVGGSLSSDGKDKEKVSSEQENGEKSVKDSVRLQKSDDADDIEYIPKEYRDFSDEHKVNPVNLFLYGESMKYNDSAAAFRYLHDLKAMYLREHIAEKKALMEREGVNGLIANRRLFAPIEKAIKEKYGDVDVLIEERKKRDEAERNVMEAARKKAEEEERKRQARFEELAGLTDEEIDNSYAEALAKGDEAAAREMLDEAARRKGYGDAISDYQGVGAWSAPSNPGYETDEARRNAVGEDSPDLNVEDMAAGYSNQPEDIFMHPDKYSQGLPTSEESGKAIQTAIDDIRNGKKGVKVKVYRAVPTSVKEGKLRNGDWVTPSKRYAELHGDNRLEGKYRIIEDEVPVSELWWDSNDVNEWGYDNGKSYRYKNVKNNRKLNDLVTRDDKGNVIPPSKRFNQRKADERYQRGVEGVKPSKAEVALRDAVMDRLRESGMEVIADVAEGQRVLDEANGKVRQMGSRTNKKMKEIADVLSEHELSEQQKTVVDVYSGKTDNLQLEVSRSDGSRRIVIRQGNDNKAGTKHSVYRHYGTKEGVITAEDILLIPEVLNRGERKPIKRGNTQLYEYVLRNVDGSEYTVLTEINNRGKETFADFYSNKKVSSTARKTRSSEAQARLDETLSAAKVEEKSKTANKSGEKLREQRVWHGSGADGIRFFRTANGEAYGFTVGGRIYIDPRIATSETPVHEYAHLWAEALRSGNAEEWQNVVELMKGTKVWDEVKGRYPELKSDDEIADEVIATYSGRRGAERLREEQRKIADGNGGVFEKAEAISALESVKQALKKFWKGVADFLHIHYKSAEEVADRVMKDMLEGVDPRMMGETKDGGVRFSAKQKRALETVSVSHKGKHQPTVVSSADGAKILNELERVIEKYENLSNRANTFIGDVAKALGASRFGSGSEYATFETKNGDIVSIRLANHNAHVSGFDHNGKDNGISIVISPKPNEGITNDGNAHITEFYYDSIKLRRAEGKPLAEIVRSIKQALYSGKFKDTTGLAERQEVNGEDVIRYQFIGEKGAAAADHAEEVSVRLDNLSVAREMEAEKKDAKAIKMATGWERGADGKWRYEIADMKEFDRNGNLLYRKHHPDYARYIELQDKELKNLFEDGEELTDKEREEYEALSKKYESDKFGGEKLDNNHTLEAYVDAPELFKAYPELKDVGLRFEDTGGNEIASYRHISSVFEVDKDDLGEIVVNTGKVSVNTRTKEVKSAVLHEMQHVIQEIEGFAKGGNPDRMKSDFLEAKAEWAARAYAHELEETAKALGEDYDQLGVEQALIKEYEDMDMLDWLPDKDTRIKGFNYYARGYADRSLDEAIKRFRLDESTRENFNPYLEYQKLSGEVEARNVQKRMGMSAEERRASLAAETEDVAREDQIFLMGYGVSEMDSEVEAATGVTEADEADEDTDDDKRFRDSLPDATAEDKDLRYSLREQTAPKHTKTAYAVFIVKQHEDGSVTLHPKMIADEAVGAPPHTWLNADTGKIKRDKQGEPIQNTRGRVSVRDAKGAPLAWRPGKHLAAYPNASQFAVEGDTKGVRDRLPDNVVFFEVEYAADRDYQLEAWEYGVNGNGKYEHSQAGLPYIPKDGYYIYRTNANPNIPAMIITGAYRVKRALTDEEAKKLNQEAGGDWYDRKSGEPMTAERLKELGLDEAGLQRKAETFDYNELEPAHDESSIAMSMPGYVRRDLDFTDKNLLKAIKENQQDASYYQSLYEQQKKNERQREQTAFEDGQVLPIEMDWRNGGYKVEGLNAIFANKDRLLDAFRTKYDSYVATMTSDGNSIEVSPWRSVLAETKKPRRRNGKPTKAEQAKAAFVERQTRRAIDSVNDVARKLGLNVEVKTDTEGLIGRDARAKGWYDTKTGEIAIILPNHTSGQDVMRTILHEGVAHHGLRELFGEDFDTFLENVYNNASKEIREAINRLAAKNDWDFKVATEEYLAGMAEDTNFDRAEYQSWWGKIKFLFLDMLRKAGLVLNKTLTDADLRYILWRSYENLKEPGRYRSILGEAEDISKQMDLKVGNFAETDNSAASVADGDSYMYRDGGGIVGHVPDAVVNRMYEDQVKDTRNRTMLGAMTGLLSKDGRKRWKNKFAESYFDYSRSVKALQDAISEATGIKVEKNEDVWKSLNAKSSIDERELDIMTRMLAVPLGNLISDMVKKSDGKYSLDDIEAYLNAKHGVEERNPYMLKQSLEKSLDMVRKDERLKALAEGYSSDEADAIAEKAVADARSETMESARRDYSGLTGLFDPTHEGKSIDELEDMARDYVSEIEDYFGNDVIDELWRRVNALNAYSLRKSYECGLLSKKQYDEVSSMYKYYVPLRGWHDGYAGDVYNYVTRGGDRSMIENALKKAYGRTSRAGNILGTMTAMANSAIVMGNKNKVAQTFMNLALNHDDTGMFTISEAWYEKNASDDSYRLVTPKLSEDMSAEEVADAIASWEEEMQSKAASGEAVVRSGKFTKDFQYNLEEWKERQHCVRVLRNGKEYMVYINGNPRATQAINGLLNPDYSSGVADDFIRKYMRYKAQVQTSLSPKFMISNLQRDAATAVGGSYAKYGSEYAADVIKNLAGNVDDIFRLFHKDRMGTLDMSVEKDRLFKEFVEHGGMTGVSSIRKKDEYEAQYAKSVKRAVNPKSSAAARGWESLMENIEYVNRCVENLTRFSVYMASRKAGKSVKDSVFDAKECSVNFNMKGSGAWGNATLRKYIMYANPALQSLRMISTWYDANKPRTIALLSSGVALGFLNALILSALCGVGGGDDDDNAYYALTDYNRHNYFNVGIGNSKFLHWRLPQEMVPLYALGQIAYDRMSGRISNDQALHQTLVQLNNLSPMAFVESELNYDQSAGNTYAKTFLKAVTPDVVSDFADAYLWQEDFLGRRIGNRSEWNTHAPEWQRVDKRTPDFFVKGFEWLDKASGGTDYKRGGLSQVLNPSAVWYILEQQGGGLSQVAHEFYNAGLAVMGAEGSEDLEAKDYPFVGKFMVDGGTDAARMRVKNEKFWMYRMEYEAKDAEIKAIGRDNKLSFDEKAARISELADDKYLTMYSAVRGWKKLRKSKSLAETDGDKEGVREADDNLKMLVDRTVRLIEKPQTVDDDWDMDDIVEEVNVDDIVDKIPDDR